MLDELFGAGVVDAGAALEPDDPVLRRVLDGVEAGRTLGELALAAGLPVREARAALARLEADGLVRRSGPSS